MIAATRQSEVAELCPQTVCSSLALPGQQSSRAFLLFLLFAADGPANQAAPLARVQRLHRDASQMHLQVSSLTFYWLTCIACCKVPVLPLLSKRTRMRKKTRISTNSITSTCGFARHALHDLAHFPFQAALKAPSPFLKQTRLDQDLQQSIEWVAARSAIQVTYSLLLAWFCACLSSGQARTRTSDLINRGSWAGALEIRCSGKLVC